MNYYGDQLNRLSGDCTVKITGENGTETKWFNLNTESREELIKWLIITDPEMSLYNKALKLGIELDNHCSDLYLPVNDVTRKLIANYEYTRSVSAFISQIDGTQWFDIPFAYPCKV